MNNIIIPNEARRYLQAQRTKLNTYFDIRAEFGQEITEMLNAAGFVPRRCVDIGCGVGVADVLLCKKTKAKIWLIDKDGEPNSAKYGFTNKISHYHSWDLIKQMMNENEVPENKGVYVSASNSDEMPKDIKADLIFSFLSCGYHYPVDVYLPWVIKALDRNGAAVLDVRDGTKEREKLEQVFSSVIEIHRRDKKTRLIMRGKM